MKRLATIGLLALAGLLAACGSGSEETVAPTAADTKAPVTTEAPTTTISDEETLEGAFLMTMMIDSQRTAEIMQEGQSLSSGMSTLSDLATFSVGITPLAAELDAIGEKWEDESRIPEKYRPAMDKWTDGIDMIASGMDRAADGAATMDLDAVDQATQEMLVGTDLIAEATDLMGEFS